MFHLRLGRHGKEGEEDHTMMVVITPFAIMTTISHTMKVEFITRKDNNINNNKDDGEGGNVFNGKMIMKIMTIIIKDMNSMKNSMTITSATAD